MDNINELIRRVKEYEPLWGSWRFTGIIFGSGGSGCVLGLSRGSSNAQEHCVVKVIYVEEPDEYNAVKNEIQTMSTLKSPYLVECLDSDVKQVVNRHGEVTGYDFLIRMNHYVPLASLLKEEEYDPEQICLQLIRDIGNALYVCHYNGVLHRDVKPENVFVDYSNGKMCFKLGDFGVAKAIGKLSGVTMTGTPDYMAPESFRYNEYSYLSDMYSFGMMLYYILNDLHFPQFISEESVSASEYNALQRVEGAKIPAPKFGNEKLQKAVLRCCEANPDDRFGDISELINMMFNQKLERIPKEKLTVENGSNRREAERKQKAGKMIRAAGISMTAVLILAVVFTILYLFSESPKEERPTIASAATAASPTEWQPEPMEIHHEPVQPFLYATEPEKWQRLYRDYLYQKELYTDYSFYVLELTKDSVPEIMFKSNTNHTTWTLLWIYGEKIYSRELTASEGAFEYEENILKITDKTGDIVKDTFYSLDKDRLVAVGHGEYSEKKNKYFWNGSEVSQKQYQSINESNFLKGEVYSLSTALFGPFTSACKPYFK